MNAMKRKNPAMKTIKINRSEIGHWITPPENGGQIVEISYARAGDVAIRRVYDRSDRRETLTAFRFSDRSEFEPQNCEPKLGRRVGQVEIVEDESAE